MYFSRRDASNDIWGNLVRSYPKNIMSILWVKFWRSICMPINRCASTSKTQKWKWWHTILAQE